VSAADDEIRRWAARVRARHPQQAARYTPEQLERSMAGWYGLLDTLGIEEHEDRVRFLALAVLLTPEQRASRLVNGVLRRTMANTDWEPSQRLDFVYKHLVGRPVAPDEEDFGPTFVP
jgi:hypothetical protein